ncbi:polysaccharide deacetylase family protein [Paenibacillus pinihumi]|uniref:polysaccharide deacetylase family protein n=1 Tax=Paenibacillus pinihumi TaxID=669462 RepID=UPI000419101A|nr:polysaccharide deacetylase family protein [Paenibacillus pinihumi]
MRSIKIMVALMLLGLSCTAEASAAPRKNRDYYEARGEVVWEVPGKKKVIALTFDDGPDPKDTPRILDLLKQHHARATFFVIGSKAGKHTDLLRREMEEGHEIANHTFTHHFFNNSFTAERIHNEIAKTQEVIYTVTGQRPTLFRPPGGMFDEAVLRIARQEGLKTIMWSWHQDTRDWSRPGVGYIVNKVLKNVHNGDIILLHDYVSGQSQTVKALEKILPELNNRGYEFVTVSELLSGAKNMVPSMK